MAKINMEALENWALKFFMNNGIGTWKSDRYCKIVAIIFDAEEDCVVLSGLIKANKKYKAIFEVAFKIDVVDTRIAEK